jgi:hypothetical protein
MKKMLYLSSLVIFLFVASLHADEKNPTIQEVKKKLDNLKIIYVLERYPNYHSELSQIRTKLLEIDDLNYDEGMMKQLSLSAILRLMYIYNTEDILFSIVPQIKESEVVSYCDFVIQHNQHDRKALKNIQEIIQVSFESIHKAEVLHQLDKAKRIIADSLELMDMTDRILEDYKTKYQTEQK